MVVRHPFAESALLIFAGAKSGITIERFGLRSKCQRTTQEIPAVVFKFDPHPLPHPGFFLYLLPVHLSIALR
jgi:hypothetical protein